MSNRIWRDLDNKLWNDASDEYERRMGLLTEGEQLRREALAEADARLRDSFPRPPAPRPALDDSSDAALDYRQNDFDRDRLEQTSRLLPPPSTPLPGIDYEAEDDIPF